MPKKEHKFARWMRKRWNPNGLPSPTVIPGFSRDNLDRLLRRLRLNKGAEIGVNFCEHSKRLCEANPHLELLCVDVWQQYDEDRRSHNPRYQARAYEASKATLEKHNATLVKAFSMDAVRDVPKESLDFVYIDAAHDFDHCMQDIIEWSKRVRRGGVVSGHDYYRFRFAGVVDAANAYTKAHRIKHWYVTSDRMPSFFWVKP